MASNAVIGLIDLSMKVVKAFGRKPVSYEKEKIKKILVINTTAIGDTLLSTPALRALAGFYRDAYITALAGSSAYPVLKNNPHIGEIIRHPGKVDFSYLFKLPGLVSKLRKGGFDLAVVLHGNDPDSVPLAYLSGAPFILGMIKTAFPYLLTWYCPRAGAGHTIRIKLDALKSLGIESVDSRMEMTLTAEEEEEAGRILEERGFTGPLACIHPFGSKPTRSWPIERAAELADRLHDELGFNIVILGGPREVEGSRQIAGMMKSEPFLTAIETELRLSAAIIKRSSVVISTDSGPMHIAEAFNIPLVAILGSTLASATGPLSGQSIVLQDLEACDVVRACKDYKCDHISCMKAIGVEEVMDAVKRLHRVSE